MSQGVGFVHLLELTKIFTSARAAVEGSVNPHQPNRDTDPRSYSQPKNRIGRILDQIGINIREELCVTCARNLVIERPIVQLGDHKGMTIECDSRFTGRQRV